MTISGVQLELVVGYGLISSYFFSNQWLIAAVGHDTGWWFGTCFIFPYIGNNNPNWRTHIFQRGRSNQDMLVAKWWSTGWQRLTSKDFTPFPLLLTAWGGSWGCKWVYKTPISWDITYIYTYIYGMVWYGKVSVQSAQCQGRPPVEP